MNAYALSTVVDQWFSIAMWGSATCAEDDHAFHAQVVAQELSVVQACVPTAVYFITACAQAWRNSMNNARYVKYYLRTCQPRKDEESYANDAEEFGIVPIAV